MDRQKFEQRCAIKFCVKLGKSTTVTYEKLQRAYGEHSIVMSTREQEKELYLNINISVN